MNGLTFVDRCEMRSLCHLDARQGHSADVRFGSVWGRTNEPTACRDEMDERSVTSLFGMGLQRRVLITNQEVESKSFDIF